MARWQPNASERLALAALELFAEQGYENTTVIDIAQRAGLTKREREALKGPGLTASMTMRSDGAASPT